VLRYEFRGEIAPAVETEAVFVEQCAAWMTRRLEAGLGSALLHACLSECDARAVDAVILWPTPASRTLYRRHGFAGRDDLLERRE
jgi:hypothetical protein